jgi:N-acetylmuramoyl-L-alanine amidase
MRLHHIFSSYLTLLTILLHLFVCSGTAFAKAGETPNLPVQSKKFKVVIDAGHGGTDPGKPSKFGFKESDIALKIALALGKELAKNPEIVVEYTRTTDVFIGLKKRGAIANKANADLFISIHCNAHNTQAYGTETYVLGLHANAQNLRVAKAENAVIFLEEDYETAYADYNINSPESIIGFDLMQEEYLEQSILIASLVQDNFREKLKRKDRSVKQAGFVVLHQTVMPSILIETGFITNVKEGRYLASNKGQKAIAKTISDAVSTYKAKVFIPEESPTFTIDTNPTADKIVSGVTFKVQLAASSRKLEPKSYNFKKLSEISRTKEGKLYKYYTGSTSNYTDIQNRLKQAKAKGYTTAYIVSFNSDNIKVPLQKVLN